MTNILHTELCESCMQVKPTGMTTKQHSQWKKHHGRRSAIERSVATLNADFDLSLLAAKVCQDCVDEKEANKRGMTIVEHIILKGDTSE